LSLFPCQFTTLAITNVIFTAAITTLLLRFDTPLFFSDNDLLGVFVTPSNAVQIVFRNSNSYIILLLLAGVRYNLY